MKNNRKHARLELQHLESRCLLAGNVTAVVADGDLIITGDVEGNSIALLQVSPGTLAIVSDGGTTTVNGQAAPLLASGPTFTVSGVTDDIIISLGDGSDDVGMILTASGDLTISMGEGDDFVGLAAFFDVPQWVQPLATIDVHDDLTISLGVGNDFTNVSNTVVFGNAIIQTGDGDDGMLLLFCTFQDVLLASAGAGNDFVGAFQINVGLFADFSMGAGDDFLDIQESIFQGLVLLRGGDGIDTLSNVNNQFAIPPFIFGFES
jgi:hypothetical protein